MGTPGYMAPEQAEDASQVKPQSDVYALGQLLKECFTYLSPMEELQKQIELDRIQNKVAKRQKNAEDTRNLIEEQVPEAIMAIVKKATKKSWEERYNTVQELSEDLQRYYKNLKVSVKKYSFLEMAKMWVKRNKATVITLRVSLVIFVFCVFFFLRYLSWKTRQEVKKAQEIAKEKQADYEKIKTEEGTQEQNLKMFYLLNALSAMNQAVYLQPKEKALEQEKWNLGYLIVQMAFQSKNYQLAYYVSEDLDKLSSIQREEKDKLKLQLKEEEEAELNEHLKQFDFWKNKYENKKQEKGYRDDLLFEISQMKEKQILEKLLEVLEQGILYFTTKQKKKDTKQEEYYIVFAEALGRLGNPVSGKFLLIGLKKMEEKIFQDPKDISEEDLNYIETLAFALGNSNAQETAREFQTIRYNLQFISRRFFENTQISFKKLSKGAISSYNDQIRLNPQYALAYNNRGFTKKDKGDIEGAIADYTEAI
ncbi:MAG: hypothetical protein AABZ60_19550, partial [Planctomycetota bacterium]